MAMKLLQARDRGNSFFFRVHLDTTKTDDSGAPDGAYVAEFTWSKTPPSGRTALQHLAAIKAEIKVLCLLAMAKEESGTALGDEGSAL